MENNVRINNIIKLFMRVAAVVQRVTALALQSEGWMLKYQPRQT